MICPNIRYSSIDDQIECPFRSEFDGLQSEKHQFFHSFQWMWEKKATLEWMSVCTRVYLHFECRKRKHLFILDCDLCNEWYKQTSLMVSFCKYWHDLKTRWILRWSYTQTLTPPYTPLLSDVHGKSGIIFDSMQTNSERFESFIANKIER